MLFSGGVRNIVRHVDVKLPAKAVYNVVADVDRYSEFVLSCQTSEVLRRPQSNYFEAALSVGFERGVFRLHADYKSEVHLYPYTSIEAYAHDNLTFRTLNHKWTFEPTSIEGHDGEACRVTADVTYEFANPLYQQAASLFESIVARPMVDAFVSRAYSIAAGSAPAAPSTASTAPSAPRVAVEGAVSSPLPRPRTPRPLQSQYEELAEAYLRQQPPPLPNAASIW